MLFFAINPKFCKHILRCRKDFSIENPGFDQFTSDKLRE